MGMANGVGHVVENAVYLLPSLVKSSLAVAEVKSCRDTILQDHWVESIGLMIRIPSL